MCTRAPARSPIASSFSARSCADGDVLGVRVGISGTELQGSLQVGLGLFVVPLGGEELADGPHAGRLLEWIDLAARHAPPQGYHAGYPFDERIARQRAAVLEIQVSELAQAGQLLGMGRVETRMARINLEGVVETGLRQIEASHLHVERPEVADNGGRLDVPRAALALEGPDAGPVQRLGFSEPAGQRIQPGESAGDAGDVGVVSTEKLLAIFQALLVDPFGLAIAGLIGAETCKFQVEDPAEVRVLAELSIQEEQKGVRAWRIAGGPDLCGGILPDFWQQGRRTGRRRRRGTAPSTDTDSRIGRRAERGGFAGPANT